MSTVIECNLAPNQTGLVAELYVPGTDTRISTTQFAYKTNDKCRVQFTFNSNPTAGEYRFTVNDGSNYGLENDRVVVTGNNGTFYLNRELALNSTTVSLLILVTAIWTNVTRTLTAQADSEGVTTLLTYITGLISTKAQDDTAITTTIPTNVSAKLSQDIEGGTNFNWAGALTKIGTTVWGSVTRTLTSIAAVFPSEAPDNWIGADAIQDHALDGKGDWATPGDVIFIYGDGVVADGNGINWLHFYNGETYTKYIPILNPVTLLPIDQTGVTAKFTLEDNNENVLLFEENLVGSTNGFAVPIHDITPQGLPGIWSIREQTTGAIIATGPAHIRYAP